MKRYILLITLFIYSVLAAVAGSEHTSAGYDGGEFSVSRSKAIAEAKAFMLQRGIAFAPQPRCSKPGKTVAEDTIHQAFYLVSGSRGFVIIAGDSRVEPVLGYSDSGTIDENNLPENVSFWLESYKKGLEALNASSQNRKEKASADNNALSSTSGSTGVSSAKQLSSPRKAPVYHPAIAPLLTTNWSQTDPFNRQCPMYNGQRCVVGCVATAMAQVIAYHKYPAEIKSIPSYTSNSYVGTLDALPATTLNWDAINSGSGADFENEAAKLSRYCGQGVSMNYGRSSGAFSDLSATALRNYFGYNPNLKIAYRSRYTAAQWDSLLYNELAAKRPLYYSGASAHEGHAFVVDGYDGAGLYHLNWGWGGYCDGYFRVSILNPYDSGKDAALSNGAYASNQLTLIGVCPDTIAVNLPTGSNSGSSSKAKLNADFQLQGTKQLGDEMTVRANIHNTGGDYNGYIYFNLGPKGNTKQVLSAYAAIAADDEQHARMNFYPLSAGEYEASISTSQGGSNIVGDTIFTITSSQTLPSDLSLVDYNVSTTSSSASITFRLKNESTERYARPVYVVLSDRVSGSSVRTYEITGGALEAGVTKGWTLNFDGLTNTGAYNFEIYQYDHSEGNDVSIVGSFFVNMPGAKNLLALTLTASAGGSINYLAKNVTAGTLSFDVPEGNNVKLTFKANHGYKLASVVLDSVDITSQLDADGAFTITQMAAAHTVVATFTLKPTYKLSVTASEGGTVEWGSGNTGSAIEWTGNTVSGASESYTVIEGDNIALRLTPTRGYFLESLLVDGKDVTTSVAASQYLIGEASAPITVVATFRQIEYVAISVAQNNRGTVSLNLIKGKPCRLRISPDLGKKVSAVTLDGVLLTATAENIYEFTPSADSSQIVVTFE